MSQSRDPAATIAAIAGILADAPAEDRELLTSVVTVARSIFGAAASSVFLFDRQAGELVFEAVSGEGEQFLVGTHFPADRGIAGWVVATGEPMAADDLTHSPLFARDLAESTGYVPQSIMAVPVVYRTEVLGVLQVLDPHPQSRSSIADLDLLAMFATQAALSLHALLRSRAARAVLLADEAEPDGMAGIVQLLATMRPEQQVKGRQLIESLHDVLAGLAR